MRALVAERIWLVGTKTPIDGAADCPSRGFDLVVLEGIWEAENAEDQRAASTATATSTPLSVAEVTKKSNASDCELENAPEGASAAEIERGAGL